jgi:hypothetical protein
MLVTVLLFRVLLSSVLPNRTIRRPVFLLLELSAHPLVLTATTKTFMMSNRARSDVPKKKMVSVIPRCVTQSPLCGDHAFSQNDLGADETNAGLLSQRPFRHIQRRK